MLEVVGFAEDVLVLILVVVVVIGLGLTELLLVEVTVTVAADLVDILVTVTGLAELL